MEVTRSIALASSTEVPPNFMTIIGVESCERSQKLHARDPSLRLRNGCAQDDAALVGHDDFVDGAILDDSALAWFRVWSSQVALGLEQFGVQDGGSGSATNRVVREHGELPVENAAGTKASHDRRHAGAGIDVESRLRAIVGLDVDDRTLGSAGKLQFLRLGAVAVPGGNDFVGLGLGLQPNGNGFGVTVFDGDAVALRAHGKGAGNYSRSVDLAEQLASLLFHFFFFITDEGDYVAQNVERGDTGISRAADGLHGDGHNCFQAEALVDRSQRENEANRGAVGIGDHVAPRFLAPGLDIDELDVAAVDLGDHQRHVFLHTQGTGVGDDSAAGLGETRLEFGGDGGIEGGKNDFGRAIGGGGRDLHLGDPRRDLGFQAPTRRLAVNLPFGAVRGGQPGHFEPGMVLEHLDKSLSNDAGGAEDANRNFAVHKVSWNFITIERSS